MKILSVLFVLVFAKASMADSLVCSSLLKDVVAQALTSVTNAYKNGAASAYDVSLVEKTVIEQRLCENSLDASALTDLANNIKARVKSMQLSYDNGAASSVDLAVIKAEQKSFYDTCASVYIPSATRQYNVGFYAITDMKTLKAACTPDAASAPASAASAASAAK